MKDGGPAFPVSGIRESDPSEESGVSGVKRPVFEFGMSLRDWFAGMVLNGKLSNQGHTYSKNHRTKKAERAKAFAEFQARRAYEIADAMLAERAKAEGTI